jgi:hypothetical protein
MLSTRLIQLIEDQWEPIAARVIGQVRHDPELVETRKLPETELRDWAREILKHLSHSLSQSGYRELGARYEGLGRLRFAESVPLHEAVHAIHILKNRMIEFVRDRGFESTTVEIYAEEELEHRVGCFFDWLVYHLVRGYEGEWRKIGKRAA